MNRERRIPTLLFAVSLVAAVPLAWGASGAASSDLEKRARVSGSVSTDVSTRATLCHIPPGNPANARTIVVGQAAVTAHLAHGDYLGECHTACSGVTCAASDQCHAAGTCDPQTGVCSNPAASNGAPCDDGNQATTSDQCDNGVCAGTVVCAGVPSAVPKTGQRGCYILAPDSEFECAGSGQDGEYQKGVSVSPRFTDNGDGTVTDNLTGLIWLKNANCYDYQDWHAALSDANNLSSGACGLTDGSVAGDWRLPNVRELHSLIDFGAFNPALPAAHPFVAVQSGGYWSSTLMTYSYVGFPSEAWLVDLLSGHIGGNTFDSTLSVWPVRGGP